MVGITIITATLVILLSAFNGIEYMVESLYSDFDTDITIRAKNGKTFLKSQLDTTVFDSVEHIEARSFAIEETVVLKHEEKRVVAQLFGVDSSYVQIADVAGHMYAGFPTLYENGGHRGLIGVALLDKLEGYIPEYGASESIIVYGPKRKIRLRFGSNPFKMEQLFISGSINYNREVNLESLVVPIEFASSLLGYKDKEVSAIYIDVDGEEYKEEVKEQLQEKLSSDFIVKTNFEKNELIFQTSKTERLFVLFILVFVFILATFNLVASLTMLFIEKKEDVETLRRIGMHRSGVFKIFFFEGLLIASKGILFGLVLGYGICLSQVFFGLLEMPNSGGEAFPVVVKWLDGLLILSIVSVLSILASYFPVKLLVRQYVKKD